MKIRFFALTFATLLAVSLLLPRAHANHPCHHGETVIKFSHVNSPTKHPKSIAANLLAKRINAEMKGKLCMEVYPKSILYNDDEVLEALLNGDVQMAAPSLSKFEKFTKKFRLFDLPFLFEDIAAVDAFQNSADGQKLKDSMRHRGLIGLAFWHNGMKQMSANRPLVSPADASGLKFRVQASDVLAAQFEVLGASHRKMPFSDVYNALQSGVVDGQENTWSNIYGNKFFEVQDGVTETNHGILDYLVVVSANWWGGLEPDARSQLAQIIKEVTATRNSESAKVNLQSRAKIISAGGTIRTLGAAQRKAWVEAMKPVWKKFENDIGTDLLKAAQSYNR